LNGVVSGLHATAYGRNASVLVVGMGMHIPYTSLSLMDCHYLAVGAPANVRPKLLWDDEHIQVI
jgi:hypothetical protein